MSTEPTSQMADAKLFVLPFKWHDGKYRAFLHRTASFNITSEDYPYLSDGLVVYGRCGIFCG